MAEAARQSGEDEAGVEVGDVIAGDDDRARRCAELFSASESWARENHGGRPNQRVINGETEQANGPGELPGRKWEAASDGRRVLNEFLQILGGGGVGELG